MSWWWIVPLVVAAGWWLYLQLRLRFAPYQEGEPADEAIDYEALADTLIKEPAPPPIKLPAPAPEPQNEPEMAQFQIAYDIVRGHEGGYQKKANDPGNKNSRGELVGTNWGINAKIYESYLKRPPTEQDMRNMPKHIAVMLYKQLYWDPIKGDEIRDQQVANILFDGHVNHGRWGYSNDAAGAGLISRWHRGAHHPKRHKPSGPGHFV
ncbi:MAG: glycosyl hydrolase 108 family protein [Bacteroidota bacterium]